METTLEQKIAVIKELCLKQSCKNPIEIAKNIMENPTINIHGPEHHIIDGTAFLTAMHNAGVEFDLKNALDEQAERGKKMPGATCGQWGVCGSASSVGAALAIIHGTGPLSDNEYYKDNLLFTSKALNNIANIGGPRCCKRNAFISLKTAVDFVNEKYNIELESGDIKCCFSHMNKQCLGEKCPFFQNRQKEV